MSLLLTACIKDTTKHLVCTDPTSAHFPDDGAFLDSEGNFVGIEVKTSTKCSFQVTKGCRPDWPRAVAIFSIAFQKKVKQCANFNELVKSISHFWVVPLEVLRNDLHASLNTNFTLSPKKVNSSKTGNYFQLLERNDIEKKFLLHQNMKKNNGFYYCIKNLQDYLNYDFSEFVTYDIR